jgi:uncharacterized protein involved in type VI secretion and phage assembly
MSIFNTMKEVALKEINKIHLPELGIITSVFPHSSGSDKDNYECNVRLKNINLELRGVQMATPCVGLVSPPSVGDLVLIDFISGDINAPVVVGRLYNDEDRPPTNKLQELVYIPPYKEDSSLRRIYLEFPGGMSLTMRDGDVTLKAGKTLISITRDGDVSIESKGNVNVKSQGSTSIKSDGDLEISASSIKMNSEKDMNIKSGTDLKIEASTSAQIKSSAQISVEATANVKIKGSTVNIN